MRGFTKVVIAGNLTRDPEVRTTASGTSVCSFSIAVNRRFTSNGEQREEVSYFNCSAWGRQGETIKQYLHKGSPLLVSGRLRQDRWEDKTTKQQRSSVEIVVEDFTFLGGAADNGAASAAPAKNTGSDEVIPDDIAEGDISLDEVPF